MSYPARAEGLGKYKQYLIGFIYANKGCDKTATDFLLIKKYAFFLFLNLFKSIAFNHDCGNFSCFSDIAVPSGKSARAVE